jgi:hypothetical protein
MPRITFESVKGIFCNFIGVACLLVTFTVGATVRYVDANGSSPSPPYTNWASAATTIQDAVNASSSGDQILVTNGVYNTGGTVVFGMMSNRVAVTVPVTVQSANGPDVTIIQGNQDPTNVTGDGAVRGVYLTNGAALTGFTISSGATRNSGDATNEQSGGGVFCNSTNVTVQNCVIIGNSAGQGGGIYGGFVTNCIISSNSAGQGGGANSSTLNNCWLTNNSAGDGGGAFGCTLSNCTLAGNSVGDGGGGADFSTVINCLMTNNFAYEVGGGSYASTVSNSFFVNNSANAGGGSGFCSVYNSVLQGNSSGYGAGTLGGSLNNCTVTGSAGIGVLDAFALNCIIYYNSGGNTYLDGEIGGGFNHCCTIPLPDGGTGNFTNAPQLSSFSHINAGSPCRGAGASADAGGLDIDGEAWLNPPSVGCDEFHPESATGPLTLAVTADNTNVAAGFAVNFIGDIEGRCIASRWEFGDGTIASNQPYTFHAWTVAGDYPVVLRAYNTDNPSGVTTTQVVHVSTGTYYVDQNSSSPAAPYDTRATAATNIQDAVDAAFAGGTVWVSNGVYNSGGRVIYNGLTNRVAIYKAVTVKSVNGPTATIISGYQDPEETFGSNAVRCVYMTNGAALSGFTLTNGATFLIDCECYDNGIYQGGGIWCESANPAISNCVITGCCASDQGGGVMNGTLYNCLVASNHADLAISGYGGGVSSATMNNSRLFGNTSYAAGGGAVYCTLNNCWIEGNYCAGNGGGACSSTLNNCTVVTNLSDYDGGGINYSTANNTISFYNVCDSDPDYSSSGLNNCCTPSLPNGGYGNITNEPAFADLSGGNFRLASNSPCINSGNNAYAPAGPDLDGNPRIQGGTVDIGAYEYQTPTSVISYAWLQQYNLPTDGSADFIDSDGDHLNNWQEWRAGTDPTNASSFLELFNPVVNASGATLTWQSGAGVMYFLERSTNLATQPFSILQSGIVGNAGTTSFQDTTVSTNGGSYFYRVGVQ